MEKWLVTGGEGFIGRRISELTGAIPYDLKSGNNILDISRLSAAAASTEGIFHCAAKISVSESMQEPEEYYLHNVTGTQNVILVAKEHDSKIVFSSSAAVYGESSVPVSETSANFPLSPYAENKKDGERLLSESGMPSVILRYFNVYGPGQSAAYAGVITSFIQAALKGEDLLIYGDGEQVRDFVYVDDVVRANIAAMQSDVQSAEIFNIGSGTKTSINQLAEMVLRLTRSNSRIRHEAARAGDIVYSQAEVTKAAEILGWKAEISFEEGLERTVLSYKALS